MTIRKRAAAATFACMGLISAFVPPAATSGDLTLGASTVLTAAANPGALDAFGRPYEVRTRVTAARFHVGTTPSTAAGGLSPAPHPRLKQQHGVRYYEVTGELSGIGHSQIGFEYVYGPIDAAGIDQSANPASPRLGLRGVAFRLVYPRHWNGRLVVYRSGGDGGRGSGHYLYQSITDEVALLRRGYAYFVTLGGGTTPPDSNPDSSSGLFWRLAPPYWRPDGEPHPDYLRAARVAPDWTEETIPDSEPGLAWFPEDEGPVETPIGSAAFATDVELITQDDVPIMRDHIRFAKNLLRQLQGAWPSQTGLVTWSRSGQAALGMNLGRTAQSPPSAIAPLADDPLLFRALTPRTGGNYNTPYVPTSGRIVDWFVIRSGLEGTTVPQPPDGRPDFHDMLPDPEYPISAPMIYVLGDVDAWYVELNGVLLANMLAAALPDSRLPNRDINAWLRLYTLRGATHQPREAYFAGPFNGGETTWYEYGGAGFNQTGRGLELPAWEDALRANNPDLLHDEAFGLDPFHLFYASVLPEEGFSLQAILNADRWARTGRRPPISAVNADLVVAPSEATVTPAYPVAPACMPVAIFVEFDFSCLASLTEDALINDPDAGFGPLDPFEVGLVETFAAGPLRFTTDPIELPAQAVPLGHRLLTPGVALLRPFTTAELRARYGTHAGYVGRVARAVARLVARRLYDPEIGALDILAAARSPVLR